MGHPTYDKVKVWMDSPGIREMISASLGTTVEVDAWTTAALASIGTDKEVLGCTPESILGAFLEAASLGLRFEGPLGEAYLNPRSVKDSKDKASKLVYRDEAQLQVGYRGLMRLARRDPRVRKIEAILVHENDIFEHRLGSAPFLNHTWDVRQPRGRIVAVYAAVRYHDGFYDFGQPYSMDAVLRHREKILADKRIRIVVQTDGSEKYYKMWDDGEKLMADYQTRRIPWIAYLEAMTQKTAVRWSAKFWDLTPDFDRAAALISIDESGRSQELEGVARRVVPESVLAGSNEPTVQMDNAVQAASLTRMGGLRAQMLRESGIGQGQMDGPPAETPTPVPAEMTDEEKAEAIRREQEEAEQFRLEQQQLLADDNQNQQQNRKGRRW